MDIISVESVAAQPSYTRGGNQVLETLTCLSRALGSPFQDRSPLFSPQSSLHLPRAGLAVGKAAL